MKKYLLLLVAMLLGLSAHADWYLVGGAYDWNDNAERKFTANGDGTFYLDVASLASNFKIKEGGNNWSTSFGTNGSELVKGETYYASTNGNNINVANSPLTDVRVTINPSNHTILVTDIPTSGGGNEPQTPDTPTQGYENVYLIGAINGSSWNSNTESYRLSPVEGRANTYAATIEFTSDSWFRIKADGTEYGTSTNNSDDDVTAGHTYTTNSANTSKAFAIKAGTYTITLTLEKNAGAGSFSVESATQGGGGNEPQTPDTPSTNGYTVYWDNSVTNWNPVKAWIWNDNNNQNFTGGTWPGQEMEQISGTAIYKITVSGESAPTNVIFSGGSEQTKDLVFQNGALYKATEKDWRDNNKWGASVTENYDPNAGGGNDPQTPDTPAAGYEHVYLVGVFGDSWNEGRTDYELKAVAGKANTYEAVFDLTPANSWFRVKADGTEYGTQGYGDVVIASGTPVTVVKYSNNDKAFQIPAGKYTVTLTLAKDAQEGSLVAVKDENYNAQTLPEDPISNLQPTGTLPVVYINVWQADKKGKVFVTDEDGNKVFNHDIRSRNLADKEYRVGEYWIDMKNCTWMEGASAIGSAESPLPLEIKARGNFTRTGFAKKPFKLKLGTKTNLLGINKKNAPSKHWALLAAADDDCGYLRNFVGFNLGERIGLPWTPGMQPVEVVINGDYRGIYFLTESIRVEDGRVEIAELKDECEDKSLVSGGYLVELDNYEEPYESQISMQEKNCPGGNYAYDPLRVTFNTPEVYSSLQREFVNGQFTTMNDLMSNVNRDNTLWSYMDLDDAVRYYLVMEIISHWEAYHGSTYLFRDRGDKQKWHWAPLWDCGNAFGGSTTGFFYNGSQFGNTWISSMRCNSRFNEQLSATWKWFMTNKYEGLITDIDNFVSHVSEAAVRDHQRWNGAPHPDGSGDTRDVVDNSDMNRRRNTVVNHLNAKINWLKGQFGNYDGQTFTEPTPDATEAVSLDPKFLPDPVSEWGNSKKLPVVTINTDAAIQYDVDVPANVSIFTYETGYEELATVSANVHGRGNDWNDTDKKSYKIEFDKKQALLGMEKSKHFVLQACTNNTYGNTIMENIAGHELSRMIGLEWTPVMEPVEVVVNDQYMGLYLLGENIRVDKNRVNIAENNNGDDWLLELDNNASNEETQYDWTCGAGHNHRVISKAPDFAKVTDETVLGQLQTSLATHVNNIAAKVTDAANSKFDNSWTAVIDPEQAAKYYVVQELMDDPMAFSTGFYMHRAAEGLWKFGPVWNFSGSKHSNGNSKEGLIHTPEAFDGAFVENLYNNVYFRWYVVSTFYKFVNGEMPANPEAAASSSPRRENAVSGGFEAPAYDPAMNGTLAQACNNIKAKDAAIAAAAALDADKWGSSAASGETIANAINEASSYLQASVDNGGAGWNVEDIQSETTGVGAIGVDSTGAAVYYNVMGRVVMNPVKGGLYIVRRGSVVTREIVK